MRWIGLLLLMQAAGMNMPSYEHPSALLRMRISRSQAEDTLHRKRAPASTSGEIRWTEASLANVPGGSDRSKHFIDYSHLLRTSGSLGVGCLLVWIIFLMWLLNSTAQDFFVPPLVYWSNALKLGPGLAGATLVALGNGAPDMVTMITAPFAVDTLNLMLSGMMCVLCITGGAVLLMLDRVRADDAPKEPAAGIVTGWDRPLLEVPHVHAKNVFGLGATLVYLAYILWSGEVTVAKAGFMPLLYLLYLGLLAWTDTRSSSAEEAKDVRSGSCPPLQGVSRPENASAFEKVLWLLAWPWYMARWLLIPPSDYYWDRIRRIVSSLAPAATLLFWTVSYLGGFHAWATPAYLCVSLMVIICGIAIFRGSDDGPSPPWFYPAITLLAKVSSVLVLLVTARELIGCIQAVGLAFDVPRTVLETTMIPWGNSLGDLVTGIALVRQGQSEAAVTAVFAAPTFNCLCSAGSALMLEAHRRGGSVALRNNTSMWADLCVQLAFLAGAFSLIALAFTCQQQRRGWFWAVALWSLYGIFLVYVIGLETRHA